MELLSVHTHFVSLALEKIISILIRDFFYTQLDKKDIRVYSRRLSLSVLYKNSIS